MMNLFRKHITVWNTKGESEKMFERRKDEGTTVMEDVKVVLRRVRW